MFHDFGIVHSFISFRNPRHIFQLQSILPLKSLEHILSNYPFREISSTKITTPASTAPKLLTNQRSISTEGTILTQYFERFGARQATHNPEISQTYKFQSVDYERFNK